MKGLLISFLVLAGYVLSVAVTAHLVRVERYSKLFFSMFAAWIPLYFVAYFATPANVWVLPDAWSRVPVKLDLMYGFVLFAFNMHSVLDFFFGVAGGFSTGLLLEILRTRRCGITTEEIIAKFRQPDGTDKIYAWRLPRLAETGYIVMDPASGDCRLTAKGAGAARIAWLAKKIFNLGMGG
ncbi:MAG: hypothetical protein KKC51_01630 [Verrucomicrobia bacterium]|nr:hypothetical protein [Verrucomicrobiota bacterium]